jgi:hypothetical protein
VKEGFLQKIEKKKSEDYKRKSWTRWLMCTFNKRFGIDTGRVVGMNRVAAETLT